MDKNSIIGLALIAAILIGFGVFNNENPETQEENIVENVIKNDSVSNQDSEINTEDTTTLTLASESISPELDSISVIANNSRKIAQFGVFHPSAEGNDEEYTIENDKIIIKIDSKGAKVTEVRLKEFEAYKDYAFDETDEVNPLQLFDKDSSQFNLSFINKATGNKVQTEKFYFTTNSEKSIIVNDKEQVISFKLNTDNPSKYIEYIYTLKPNSYELDYSLNIVGLENELENEITLDFNHKGLSSEKLVSQERMISSVFYKYKDENRDYLSETSSDEEDLEAKTDWIAFKQQYFSTIISSPEGFNPENSSIKVDVLTGEKYNKHYIAKLNLTKPLTDHTNIPLAFYFGPNDYETLLARGNDQEEIINLGWGIFGFVNKYMIIPIFNVLNSTGLQIGIIILMLTFVLRLIILPLTYKNYKSSAKMKVLKPEIEKINEKYKDGKDSVKKQQETMALYRSTGVNPMAGCIPMLIQMPILFAAFRFFPASLDLRQKAFLWAEDLSAYDSVYSWSGFEIPFYGNHISLFTILMCISTLFYTMMNNNNMQQPSQPGMPNMKVMMYIFPFMMLFFFNNYASGLSLYYLAGNLISMGLMFAVKKYMVDEEKIRLKIETNKATPKKKSKFQQRLEDAAKQQRQK